MAAGVDLAPPTPAVVITFFARRSRTSGTPTLSERAVSYLADLRRRGPVATSGDVLADCYMAARSGLQAALLRRRGAKEKLAYIVRRIEQHHEEQRTMPHAYISTACQHLRHQECRRECKFCSATCQCPCHVRVEAVEAA